MRRGKEKVPGRLLTKQMIGWQQAYKQERKKVQTIVKASEMTGFNFRDVIKQSLFKMRDMLKNVPKEHTKELAQQPETEEGE